MIIGDNNAKDFIICKKAARKIPVCLIFYFLISTTGLVSMPIGRI